MKHAMLTEDAKAWLRTISQDRARAFKHIQCALIVLLSA